MLFIVLPLYLHYSCLHHSSQVSVQLAFIFGTVTHAGRSVTIITYHVVSAVFRNFKGSKVKVSRNNMGNEVDMNEIELDIEF